MADVPETGETEPTRQRASLPATKGIGEKRGRGRPKGIEKPPGSGRQKGVGNVASTEAKATARGVLDKAAGRITQRAVNTALGLKIRVGEAAGPHPTYVYPSEASQMKALEMCMRKLVPDLSAMTAEIDQTVHDESEPADNRHVARAILSLLSGGVEPGGKLAMADKDEVLVRLPRSLKDTVGGEEIGDGASPAVADGVDAGADSSPAPAPLPAEPEGQIGDIEQISSTIYLQCVRGRSGLAWAVVRDGVLGNAEPYPTRAEARAAAQRRVGMRDAVAIGEDVPEATRPAPRPDERPWPRKQPRVVLGHQSAKGHYRNG